MRNQAAPVWVPSVGVTLLGGFGATVDGARVPETAWRLKKAREVVKLLALAPRHRLHREQVMDALWRERSPAAAANNLHQAVHVARRALGAAAIEVRQQMLGLNADVDVDRFRAAVADARRVGRASAYRTALALYGGELLPENRYEDWVEDPREELAEIAAELARELAEIGAQEPDRARPLPTIATSFVGRDGELIELKALLRRTRLLTLAGTGGIGKTRLALELARGVESSYPDGAALVELAALTDARLVPDAVATALDVQAPSGRSPLEAVAEHLAPRSLLLVVDNCEHLLTASMELADVVLRAAPGVTILATSREPLRTPGEVVFRVASLDIPDAERVHDPQELLEYEAVRLFVERSQAASQGFALDERNATDVARICNRLDGLPLALELAASRTGALAPAAIAARLDDRFRLLRGAGRASPTRQQALTATLRWSHELLTADERTLFRRLAVFAGGFDLEAVERVCAEHGRDATGIADVLARLVEKSLVTTGDALAREGRYRLLESVRLYARERLAEAGEAATLTGRHAQWALALAEQQRGSRRLDRDAANLQAALDALSRGGGDDALRLCVALLPFWMRRMDLHEARCHLERALAAAPERGTLRAKALLAAAAIDLRSGTVARGLAHARESQLIAFEVGDDMAQWHALELLGEFNLANDSLDVAIGWLQSALKLAQREGLAAQEAACVCSLGIAHWMLGDLARAEELVGRSVELFDALAGSPERIPSPVSYAETMRSGNRTGVRVVFEDTLQPFVEISCAAAAGYALANQAGIARGRGDLARARLLLDESAARFDDAADERGAATVLVRRAYLELAKGSLDSAREALQQALSSRRAQGDRRGIGLVLAGLALIATTAGEYEQAEHHLSEARTILRRASDRWAQANLLWRTADLAFARGTVDDAEAALREARAVLGPTQRERWIASTLAGLADVALLRGDREHASALLSDARDRYAARHDALGAADVESRLRNLARGDAAATRPLKAGQAALAY